MSLINPKVGLLWGLIAVVPFLILSLLPNSEFPNLLTVFWPLAIGIATSYEPSRQALIRDEGTLRLRVSLLVARVVSICLPVAWIALAGSNVAAGLLSLATLAGVLGVHEKCRRAALRRG